MSFKAMIEKDLQASFNLNEFAVKAKHFFNKENEDLAVIYDETTDVILDRGEYGGVEATVPSLQVATSKAKNITHKSIFVIAENSFGVVEIHHQNDKTTKIYLDKQND